MKYGLGIRLMIAFMVGGLAVVYKIVLNPRYKQSEISVVIQVPRKFLFDMVTKTENVPKYFSWVTNLRENRFDKRNISIGKRYHGIINLPFLGQHQIAYKVTELTDGNWLTLRPDRPDISYFNTEIVMIISSITQTESQFQMKIAYHRTSALFQITMGRFLRWLTDKQMERIGMVVKHMAKEKWWKFRFPKGLNGTGVMPAEPNYDEDPVQDLSRVDVQRYLSKREWQKLYRKTMTGEF